MGNIVQGSSCWLWSPVYTPAGLLLPLNLPSADQRFHREDRAKAADLAVHTGRRLYTDSASSYRGLQGYRHAYGNHTQKEYARGDVHENRAECLCSLLKPYLRVFRGLSKMTLPGYLGFFQFLRNFRQLTVCEQAEMILYAALDPAVASRARKGDFVRCLDHFDLLQTARNRVGTPGEGDAGFDGRRVALETLR